MASFRFGKRLPDAPANITAPMTIAIFPLVFTEAYSGRAPFMK